MAGGLRVWPELRDLLDLLRDGWWASDGPDRTARWVAEHLAGEPLLDHDGAVEAAMRMPDALRPGVLDALPSAERAGARPGRDVHHAVEALRSARDRQLEDLDRARDDGPGGGAGTLSWSQLVGCTMSEDAAMSGYIDAPRPVRTRLGSLDSWLGGGLYPGVNVLMASPGAGKTAFAVQVLATNAWHGGDGVMFSLEMPVTQVKMRVASWLSVNDMTLRPVPWNGTQIVAARSWAALDWPFVAGQLPREARLLEAALGADPTSAPLTEAVDAMRGVPGGLGAVRAAMDVGGDATLDALRDAQDNVFPHMAVTSRFRTAEAICAEVGRVASELPRPPLVVVDYLQIVEAAREVSGLGETEATKDASDRLAAAARDTGCPILCVVAKRKGADGGMESARGSSAIAYNAQSVMHIDVDRERARARPDGDPWRPVTLSISKNRSGQTSEGVPLWFDGAHNEFSDGDEPPYAVTAGRG